MPFGAWASHILTQFLYFRIPEIKGFQKICIFTSFYKLDPLPVSPYGVMVPSGAWASHVSDFRPDFKNPLDDSLQNMTILHGESI